MISILLDANGEHESTVLFENCEDEITLLPIVSPVSHIRVENGVTLGLK
jgi:hypothetical protein